MAAILPTLNLRKNQTGELSYAQVDANWTNIGTAVDANTTAISNKADLAGANFIGSVSTKGKFIGNNADGTNTVDIYNAGPTGAGNAVMSFEVNGSERLRIDKSGNVGINNAAPGARLTVGAATSGVALSDVAYMAGYSTTPQFRYTFNQAGAGILGIGSDGVGALIFGRASGITGAVQNEWARFDANGNLAVGTIAPGAKLDVESGSTPLNTLFGSSASTVEIALSSSGNSATPRIGAQANDLYWKTSGTERMRLNSAGQLGLNITAPDQKLTIASGSDATNANDGVSFYGSGTNKQAAILSFNAGGFNGDLRLYTKVSGSASTTVTEAMRIDPFGNVGIGSTAPAGKLEVRSATAPDIAVSASGVSIGNSTGALKFYSDSNNTSRWAGVVGIIPAGSAGIDYTGLAFYTNNGGTANAERARIDSAGNLLVGVTSGTVHVISKALSEGATVLSVQGGGTYSASFSAASGTGVNGAACAVSVMRNTTTSRSINAAGTINASGADYAEYMTKAAACGAVAKGQIVGVTAAGEITDRYADAVSFLIKSTDPSLVGGDGWFTEQPPLEPQFVAPAYAGSNPPGDAPHEPSATQPPLEPAVPASDADDEAVAAYQAACAQYRTNLAAYTAEQVAYQTALTAHQRAVDTFAADQKAYADAVQAAHATFTAVDMVAYQTALAAFNGRLEAARANVDRIAYCGQVPCNVTGGAPGQYVVPVQDGDGIKGELVARAAMTLDQYMRAVGIVQNILPDGRANVRVKPV